MANPCVAPLALEENGLSHAEAQEVGQTTVITVANQMKSGEFKDDPERGRFKAWWLTQTQWRVSDQFRKRRQHAEHHPGLEAKTDLMEAVPDDAVAERLATCWEAVGFNAEVAQVRAEERGDGFLCGLCEDLGVLCVKKSS